jgi:hypothetical protein
MLAAQMRAGTPMPSLAKCATSNNKRGLRYRSRMVVRAAAGELIIHLLSSLS